MGPPRKTRSSARTATKAATAAAQFNNNDKSSKHSSNNTPKSSKKGSKKAAKKVVEQESADEYDEPMNNLDEPQYESEEGKSISRKKIYLLIIFFVKFKFKFILLIL